MAIRNHLLIMKIFCFSAAFSICSWAMPAHAVQAHGGAEGLVSHQIGHILFIAGMGYLLYRIYHNRINGPGWFEFKSFLWLIILWNFLTFFGHWMGEYVYQDKFIRQGPQVKAFIINNTFDAFYYLTRLDHLLLVPSFVMLLLALKKLRSVQ